MDAESKVREAGSEKISSLDLQLCYVRTGTYVRTYVQYCSVRTITGRRTIEYY